MSPGLTAATAGNFSQTCAGGAVGAGGSGELSCDDPQAVAVRAIAAGDSHTCALMAGGGVRCWGSNVYGALGDGAPSDHVLTPTPVQGICQ